MPRQRQDAAKLTPMVQKNSLNFREVRPRTFVILTVALGRFSFGMGGLNYCGQLNLFFETINELNVAFPPVVVRPTRDVAAGRLAGTGMYARPLLPKMLIESRSNKIRLGTTSFNAACKFAATLPGRCSQS